MDFSQQSSKEDYGLNIDERNKKRSDFVSSFNSRFHNNSNSENSGGSRKAGEYLSEFAKQPGVSKVLSGAKDYRDGVTNKNAAQETSKAPQSSGGVMQMLGQSSTPSQAQPAKASTTPANKVTQQPAPITAGGIDYAAWAKDSVANDPTSAAAGADAAWWEKTYRKNNAEYEQNKAMMASYQGPKTWDELKANAQARSGQGDGKSRNTESINDYNLYTKYSTAKQGVEDWEKNSAKYRR